MAIGLALGRGYGSAAVQPERRINGQDRNPGGLTTARLSLLGDWHQGDQPLRHEAATSRQDVAFVRSMPPRRSSFARSAALVTCEFHLSFRSGLSIPFRDRQ